MPFDNPRQRQFSSKRRARTPSSNPAGGAQQPAPRTNGNPQQKHAQWLARASEADRLGDPVEAELCRQYAEHWYRVSRGQG